MSELEPVVEERAFKSFLGCFEHPISEVLKLRNNAFALGIRLFFGVRVYPDRDGAIALLRCVNNEDERPYAKALYHIWCAERAEEIYKDEFYRKACRAVRRQSESGEYLAMLIYGIGRMGQSDPRPVKLIKSLFERAANAGLLAAYYPASLLTQYVNPRARFRALAEENLVFDAILTRMQIQGPSFLSEDYKLTQDDILFTSLFYAIVGARDTPESVTAISVLKRAGFTTVNRTMIKEILRFSRSLAFVPDELLTSRESELVRGYLLRDPEARKLGVSCKRIDAKLQVIDADLKTYIPKRRSNVAQYLEYEKLSK